MLKGKNAVITGCNRGIGKAILENFAYNGANVHACVRTKSKEFEELCKNLEEKYSVWVKPVYFDLTDKIAMKEAFLSIKNEKMPVDILVNNAGIVYNGLYQMTTMPVMEELFQNNFVSQMLFTQYILKIMMKQKSGSIINISSSGGIDCNAGRVAYNVSKAAVIAGTKTLAKEVGQYNIRVNAVAPGLTATDMAKDNTPDDLLEQEIARTALGRIGEPGEIASVVSFLASDLSSFVTGQVWRVDGGMQHVTG